MSGSRAQLLRYAATWVLVVSVTAGLSWGAIARAGEAATPVSYTHLTLATSDLV